MFLQSIRWRLPLTYAGIAFVAAVILGIALLATLRGYYGEREREHLENNARAISQTVREMQAFNMPQDEVNAQLRNLAFIMQARVRMLDEHETVIADSGTPLKFLSITYSDATLVETDFDGAVPATRVDAPMMITVPTALPFGDIAPISMTSPGEEMSFFAVSSTPFGFDLAGEVTTGVVSDQVARLPIYDLDGQLSGYVELSEGASFGSHIVGNVAMALVFASVIALVIAAFIGWVVSRQITTPLLALTEGAQRMARGDLHMRVRLSSRGELGALANTFNDMAAQVEGTITALRRFVADAAHELHTPLTALHTDLELAATETNAARQTLYARRAYDQVRRMEALTDNLLNLSRIESKTNGASFQRVDLVRLIREFIEVYASRAEQVGLNLMLAIPDSPLYVCGDETQLRRAFGNLLDNAIKFTPEGGIVELKLERVHDRVRITVSDTGVGIPPDDLPYLFQRFHRGRNAHHCSGSGLGLAIIRAIIDLHHGEIAVQSVPGDTRFVLQLPTG